MQFFVPEEYIAPEGPLPDLAIGTRYKLYFKNTQDPNSYFFVGTYDGATPENFLKFVNIVYPGGYQVPSDNTVVPQLYTFMPVAEGGRRRRGTRGSKHRGSKHRGSKRRGSRRQRRN